MATQDKCSYCGSQNYGSGCAYGPKGRHVHINNSGKCIYCGSINIGRGCALNPFDNIHVRGVDYNAMIKETIENGITVGYLLRRLCTPIKDWAACKIGLIDEKGSILRKPVTIEERAVLTKSDFYVLRLKGLINESELDILNNSIYLKKNETTATTKNLIEQYSLEIETGSKIKEIIDQLQAVITEANCKGLDLSSIEKMILKSFLDESNLQ